MGTHDAEGRVGALGRGQGGWGFEDGFVVCSAMGMPGLYIIIFVYLYCCILL